MATTDQALIGLALCCIYLFVLALLDGIAIRQLEVRVHDLERKMKDK